MGRPAEVPVLQDELNRKVFETMDWLAHAVESGRIEPAQYSTACDAVFKAVSGLVDGDLMRIMEAASQIAKHKGVEKVVLVKGHGMAVLTREFGASHFVAELYNEGVLTRHAFNEYDTPGESKVAMQKLAKILLGKGYNEV